MGMFQNLVGKFGSRAENVSGEPPARSRSFSASGYRDAEVAREAEDRRRREERAEAEQVLTPDIAPVAEALAAHDEDVGLVDPPAPAPTVPQDDPLPWDEAVGWLSQRSAGSRNFVAQYWNWDHDLRVVEYLVKQPDIDAGVAAGIFWLTAAAEDYFPWTDEDPEGEVDHKIAELTSIIGRRFAEGDLAPAAHGFDDSWDCKRLKNRLTDLYDQGRLDWSPEHIPSQSSGELLGFEDIPEEERDEILEFLARFGVR
jgi:hypothetical protein